MYAVVNRVYATSDIMEGMSIGHMVKGYNKFIKMDYSYDLTMIDKEVGNAVLASKQFEITRDPCLISAPDIKTSYWKVIDSWVWTTYTGYRLISLGEIKIEYQLISDEDYIDLLLK